MNCKTQLIIRITIIIIIVNILSLPHLLTAVFTERKDISTFSFLGISEASFYISCLFFSLLSHTDWPAFPSHCVAVNVVAVTVMLCLDSPRATASYFPFSMFVTTEISPQPTTCLNFQAIIGEVLAIAYSMWGIRGMEVFQVLRLAVPVWWQNCLFIEYTKLHGPYFLTRTIKTRDSFN